MMKKIEDDGELRIRLVDELRQFMNETMDRLGYAGPGIDDPFSTFDFIKSQEEISTGEVCVKGDGHAQLETLKAWAVMLNEIGITEIPKQYQDEEYFS